MDLWLAGIDERSSQSGVALGLKYFGIPLMLGAWLALHGLLSRSKSNGAPGYIPEVQQPNRPSAAGVRGIRRRGLAMAGFRGRRFRAGALGQAEPAGQGGDEVREAACRRAGRLDRALS